MILALPIRACRFSIQARGVVSPQAWLENDNDLASLREEPRFRALLAKLD